MSKHHSVIVSLLVLLMLLISACGSPLNAGSPATMAPSATATPDACARANIQAGISAVNKIMREFDDESQLAQYVPQSQLALHIAALQKIRRDAQDQSVPTCLARLKQLQLNDMNTVIDTLMVFLGNGDPQAVKAGVRGAQQIHDAYLVEMAGLLGITAVVVTRAPTVSATPGAVGTTSPPGTSQTAVPQVTTSTSSAVVALNTGPNPVSLRAEPNPSAQVLATLAAGASATALGITSDGSWIQVSVPGQAGTTAWVLATDVQLTNANP